MTVFVYVNTSKPSGDPDHITVRISHIDPQQTSSVRKKGNISAVETLIS
jgi:hypothetical protein